MLATASETRMRIVRYSLLLGWFVLLAACWVDLGQSRITDAADTWGIPGFIGKAVEVRGEHLQPQVYNPVPRFFWGGAVPIVVLLLIFGGHDIWRRICPLSAFSQIPRLFGWQRKIGKDGERQLALMQPNSFFARNALVIQFILFALGVTLRLTLTSANPHALVIFTLITLLLAISVGFLWGGKTWCHYFCPMNVVQLALSGPRGLNANRPVPGISQSMCRKPSSSGDVSICVGCNSPCPDIDIERNYWQNLTKKSKSFVVYGYLGVVAGFIHGLYATAGSFNYGAAVWYDSNWQAMGFAPFGTFLPVPRMAGAMVLMLSWIALASLLGFLSEAVMKYFLNKSYAAEIAEEKAINRSMVISTALALLLLIFRVALPGLSWLNHELVEIIGWAATIAIVIWAHQSWQRSSSAHHKEGLAENLRKRLLNARKDWSAYLSGRQIEDLSADEIYMLGHLAPSLESANKIAFYRDFLTDSVQQGHADSIEGRRVLAELRASCSISEEDHMRIIDSLKGEYDINDALLVSASLRTNSFKQALQGLIFTGIEQGLALADAITQQAESIAKLREDFAISAAEETQIIEEFSSDSGPLATAINHLISQLSDIDQLHIHLGSQPAQVFIQQYLNTQARGVIKQCVELFGGMDAADASWQKLGGAFANCHPLSAPCALEQTHISLPTGLIKLLRTNVFHRPAELKLSREKAFLRLSKIDEPYVQLAVARSALDYAYPWAHTAFTAAVKTLMPTTEATQQLQVKPRLRVKLRTSEGAETLWDEGFSAGRAPDNLWVLPYEEASRHHFRIFQEAGVFYCEDLNSANGTTLNGQFLQGRREPLSDTNIISITHATPPIYVDVISQMMGANITAVEGFFLFAGLDIGKCISHDLLWQLCCKANWVDCQHPLPNSSPGESTVLVLKGSISCNFLGADGHTPINTQLNTGECVDLAYMPRVLKWGADDTELLAAIWPSSTFATLAQAAPQLLVQVFSHSNCVLKQLYIQPVGTVVPLNSL